jgi:hypothetical protein
MLDFTLTDGNVTVSEVYRINVIGFIEEELENEEDTGLIAGSDLSE